MGSSGPLKLKGSLKGLLSQPINPQTPPRPARQAGVSEPGSFSPRRPLEQAADNEKQIKMRAMIAKRVKEETVYCTDEHFMKHYLPPIPNGVDITTVLNDLKDGKYLQKSDAHAQDLLGDFSVKPSELKRRRGLKTGENIIFAPLADITTAIRDSAGASKNAFRMRVVPYKELKSEIPGCSFKIDACTTASKMLPGALHLTDVVVPFEFKVLNNRDKQQEASSNRLQLVSAIVHIMNDDVRRNFAFGVTIEDDRVSLWYFSRTHSVKATSFSYVESPEKLVQVLTALSCATEAQLGFDPRITLLSDMSYLYEFPVTEQDDITTVTDAHKEPGRPSPPPTASDATTIPQAIYFRTNAALGEVRAVRVAGRTTRIFKGKQVISKDDPTPLGGATDVIVKDVWIDADSPTEVQIQQQLFEDIEEFATSSEKDWKEHPLLKDFADGDKAALESLLHDARYKELFLCAVRESEGEGNLPVHPQAWDSDQIFMDVVLTKEAPDISGSARTGSIPVTAAPRFPVAEDTSPSRLRKFRPKKRCFFLFDQVCTRVSALPTLGEAMDVLRQTHVALILMFCAGWVHRDISSGNVLAMRKDGGTSWQAKLADLEYARKFPSDDSASSDPKTGTPYFMAWEIQSGFNLFDKQPQAQTQEYKPRQRAANKHQQQGDDMRSANDVKVVKKHTYAHDLESLWWLVLFVITTLISYQESYDSAWKYFEGNNSVARLWLLSGDPFPKLHPDLGDFVKPLGDVRGALMESYYRRNPAIKTVTLGDFAKSCAAYLDLFDDIKDSEATWGPMTLHSTLKANTAADTPVINDTQGSTAAQSYSKKRKGGERPATQEPSRRSSRLTAKLAADSKDDEPGPSKKARR